VRPAIVLVFYVPMVVVSTVLIAWQLCWLRIIAI